MTICFKRRGSEVGGHVTFLCLKTQIRILYNKENAQFIKLQFDRILCYPNTANDTKQCMAPLPSPLPYPLSHHHSQLTPRNN